MANASCKFAWAAAISATAEPRPPYTECSSRTITAVCRRHSSATGPASSGFRLGADFMRQGLGPFGPSKQAALVQPKHHGEGLRFPGFLEHGALGAAWETW